MRKGQGIAAGDFGGVKILYEDNHVICAVKPCGTLSQADGSAAADMLTILKAYIKEKYGKQGEAYLGLVHRLDRPVGGVMVFARTSKAAGRLSAQIRGRTVKKVYFAVLGGSPGGASGRLEHIIKKDRMVNLVRVTEAESTDAVSKDYAALDYVTLAAQTPCDSMDGSGGGGRGGVAASGARNSPLTLVRVNLITGKPHQIRAQFAHIGCPVIGDRKYGGAARDRQRQSYAPAPGGSMLVQMPEGPALWAASLAFSHPVQKAPIIVSAPPPDEYPWNLFARESYNNM